METKINAKTTVKFDVFLSKPTSTAFSPLNLFNFFNLFNTPQLPSTFLNLPKP